MAEKTVKVALALGGGGVRGLAHIGVIRALAKDIKIDIISGTSMGAVIGGNYALYQDIESLEKKVLEILKIKEIVEIEKIVSTQTAGEEKKLIVETILSFVKKLYFINLRALKRWIFNVKEISWIFDQLGLDTDFKNTVIPFGCTSVDLRTGEEIIFSQGNMKEAILASIALPGVFPPVKRGDKLLIDGGILGSVPVDLAREMGADIIIGVGVEAEVDYNKKLGNALDIMFQADAIRAYKLSELRLESADIKIYPDVADISWASFSRASECIKAGEEAANKAKPQILELLQQKKTKKFWKRLNPFTK
ncbi:MAG: patatin-like phospholipase family protein [Candidatus Omnitrophota bacterium]